MSLQKFTGKLSNSPVFKNFEKENKGSYLTAGFFVLDLEEKKNLYQLDYFIPGKKKVAAFNMGKDITMQMMDLVSEKTPEKLDMKSRIDLDNLPGILEDEMKNRGITSGIKKIIAVLQNLEGKKIWNLSCILSGMEILRSHIDDESETILKMDKSSLMDIMKAVPASQLKGKMALAAGAAAGATGATGKAGKAEATGKATKEALKVEMEKLNKLEEAIEKEKKEIEVELAKPEKATKAEKTAKSEKKVAKKK